MRLSKILSVAALSLALVHPAMAQTDPHHPADSKPPATSEAPAGGAGSTSPNAPANAMMGCSDMMGMMGMMQMMQMMQSMQSMQMEMMQQMLEMQKSLAAGRNPQESSP